LGGSFFILCSNESINDEMPDWLNDENAKVEDVKYNGRSVSLYPLDLIYGTTSIIKLKLQILVEIHVKKKRSAVTNNMGRHIRLQPKINYLLVERLFLFFFCFKTPPKFQPKNKPGQCYCSKCKNSIANYTQPFKSYQIRLLHEFCRACPPQTFLHTGNGLR
jgi:hypothetical protein